MSARRVFKLALFGLSDHERRVPQSMANSASNSERAYPILESDDRSADIVFLDVDNRDAIKEWTVKRFNGEPITVLIGKNDAPANTRHLYQQRPLAGHKFLRMLDHITITRFKHLPELCNILLDIVRPPE